MRTSCCRPMAGSSGTRRRASVSPVKSTLRGFALALAIVASACASGDPDLAALQRESAASLRMPDVVELGHFSGDKRSTLEGSQPAFDGRVFGIQVAEADVRSFYDRELTRLGWQADRLAPSPRNPQPAAPGLVQGVFGLPPRPLVQPPPS